jgi:hypothetical protein
MRFKLSVFNPSQYRRGGYVTVPWQPIQKRTGIDPKNVVLLDKSDQLLRVQVDHLDESDTSRDTFSFLLVDAIPPGAEDYSVPSAFLRLDEGSPPSSPASKGTHVPNLQTTEDGVELWNDTLFVSLCLSPSRGKDRNNWYAGSADSVRLYGKEILDAWMAELVGWGGHDPEKRCMQVDKLQLWNPAWKDRPFEERSMFDCPYRLVSQCLGPVRAAVTIASSPFYYQYSDPFTRQPEQMECKLYRIISLYAGANYVLEELYVKGICPEKLQEKDGRPKMIDLCFSARYFACMDLGFEPAIYSFEGVPDWFAVGAPQGHAFLPHPGYGFATDVHTASLVHPHPGYPNGPLAYRTFSWHISPSKNAKCLHLFMRGHPAGFDSMTGQAWYEHIFKPLDKVEVK